MPVCRQSEDAGEQNALRGEKRQTVERIADAGEKSLFMFIQPYDVKSVRRRVMRRRGECREKQHQDQQRHPCGEWDCECHQEKQERQQRLTGENPPAFPPEKVDTGRPERLQYPGKTEQTGPEGNGGVAHSRVEGLEHDDGKRRDHGIGEALRNIQCRHP